MTSLLYAVRRRLRLAWALATVQLVAPAVAAAALVLVLIGRVRPWSWPEPAAVAVAGAAMLTVVAAALAVRVPITVAARAADRGLATGDAFATALELERRHPPSPLADHVKARAVDLAAGRSASDAVPLRLRPRRLLVVGVLATCAVVLGLVANHQDDVRRRQAGEQRALAAEAARQAKAADELKKAAQSRGQEEVARQVQELARALAAATNLQEGRAAVDKTARELASGLSPDLLAQKAAARGLDRTLAASPLPQTGNGDATSQLQALAGALSKLSPEERLALADRLAGLAATQTTGDPAAARALEQAAGALRAGDLGTAGAALNAAAAAQSATSTSVGDQEAALSALSSLAATEAALSAAAAGQNQGGHQGQDGGQGQGAGAEQGQGGQGQGAGAGQGSQGQGQGGGQGQAAGGGSGQAGGTGTPTGSGTGGAGTPNGTGNNASVGLQEATIFAPSAQGAPGPQLNANGQIGEGPTQATAGRATGPNTASGGQVPLASVLAQSQAQATQAIDRLGLAPSQRALVQAYFAALAAAGS